jgi:hypothetical protein
MSCCSSRMKEDMKRKISLAITDLIDLATIVHLCPSNDLTKPLSAVKFSVEPSTKATATDSYRLATIKRYVLFDLDTTDPFEFIIPSKDVQRIVSIIGLYGTEYRVVTLDVDDYESTVEFSDPAMKWSTTTGPYRYAWPDLSSVLIERKPGISASDPVGLNLEFLDDVRKLAGISNATVKLMSLDGPDKPFTLESRDGRTMVYVMLSRF